MDKEHVIFAEYVAGSRRGGEEGGFSRWGVLQSQSRNKFSLLALVSLNKASLGPGQASLQKLDFARRCVLIVLAG